MTLDINREDLFIRSIGLPDQPTTDMYTSLLSLTQQTSSHSTELMKDITLTRHEDTRLLTDVEVFAKSVFGMTEQHNPYPTKSSYRNYTEQQLVDYISLLLELVPVKVAAAKTGITLSSAYRFRKMWNTHGAIPEKKKRGPIKVDVLKEEHTSFITQLVDNHAPITLRQMREKLAEVYPNVSITDLDPLFLREVHNQMKAKATTYVKSEQSSKPLEQVNKLYHYFVDDERNEKRQRATNDPMNRLLSFHL
ncbi:hypothetical protein BDB01DRAFT_905643 [Pilobolus umbonatus]|nr:hypothetical protein BDB01DRAFT_905643 [Pilobolus umbonatus]